MKIVHTLLRYPPATGGVENYVRELVERLRNRGEEVRVETTNLKTHHPPTFLEPTVSDPPYVHRHHVRTFEVIGYPLPDDLREELNNLPIDILHAHAFWYAPADIAARVALKRNIRFVLNPYYHNTENRRTLKWQLYRILYGKATVAAADAVIVISPFERDLLRKDRFSLQRVELIPPGIEIKLFKRPLPNPFPSWGIKGDNILLFAGRIAKSKGLDLLIDAFANIRKQINDIRLVIIGEDFGYRQAGEAQAKRCGINNAITWTGRVSRRELLGAYQHARAFVFPSRFEAFGIVILEAGASRCPVVATRGSAIPYVVRDKETGLLFEPENSDDLARKIITVIKNPSLAKRLGNAAYERAQREFAWNRSINKLHALYTDLLRTKKEKEG